jgi:hypothetical protein
VVVEAAVRWVDGTPEDSMRLVAAVEALQAERADPDAPTEREITWGQVVAGDEIYSPKTDRWYEVTRAVHPGNGKSKINAKGIPKPLQPDSAALIKVRRGETGVAVDMFASVLWSA